MSDYKSSLFTQRKQNEINNIVNSVTTPLNINKIKMRVVTKHVTPQLVQGTTYTIPSSSFSVDGSNIKSILAISVQASIVYVVNTESINSAIPLSFFLGEVSSSIGVNTSDTLINIGHEISSKRQVILACFCLVEEI